MKKKSWLFAAVGILVVALAAPAAYGAITGNKAQAGAWQEHFNYMRDLHSKYGFGPMGYMMGGSGFNGMMGNYNGGYGGMMGGYYPPAGPEPSPDVNQKDVANLTLKVMPKGKQGADGKMHDAFSPADFTLKKGVPVRITINNYDNMPHSLTSYGLGLNIQAKGAPKEGTPGVTTFTFTPQKEGDYKWLCVDPCDLEANGWAMSQDGYMQGTIHVQP